MKNKICMSVVMLISTLLIPKQCALAQDYDTLYSYPNLLLPSDEGFALIDSIDYPSHKAITDINFYIGINTFSTLPGELIIKVTSPWDQEVTLHNHNNDPQFPCWIDADAEEDGPGSLDDYIGYDALGQWMMSVIRYAGFYPFLWESWRIEVIGEPLVGIDDENKPLLTGLDSNYPNPFNSATVIHFTIAQPEEVSFAVYDILGGLVRIFGPTSYKPGHHQLKWDGTNAADEPVASGLYFLKMAAGDSQKRRVFTRKLTLLR